jgi:WD40 repeat protein/predicted Ser/Thr protein kinase
VKALFLQAADLDSQWRGAFLDEQCAGDAALRAAVEELLHFDAKAQSAPDFLHSPAADTRAYLPPPTAVPVSIGRFRVVRLLGEGGMGTVYEAEQDNPRRAVALKVIRPGLVSPDLVKRFQHEAHILGRLQHPGIAQIFDAGLADDGRPFFAMEFIHGLPLGEFAGRRQLDSAARLTLLARVCDAVQHAHDQGVIHRDLKPGNILVEESGQPKVLDFGVAHAADLQTTASRTQSGQLLGTLSYMSPEQVTGDPQALDGRSDVYTLGVILFELLTGRLPYNLHQLPLPEVARVIREREPSRLGLIDTHFRGDVETIVAKALEKDKARRYPDPAALASDIRRYLNHEPILARPPSALYQLRKFARRNKGLVGGVLATGAALVLGLVGTIFFAVNEARQRGQAEQSARVAEFQTYRARIAAAAAALAGHDVADAARQLREAPEELRDWEWRHLRSRLDDSSSVIPLPAGEVDYLLAAPDRLRVAAFISDGLRVMGPETGESKTMPLGPEHRHVVTATQTQRGLRVVAWVGDAAFDLLDENGRVHCRVEVPGAAGPCRVAVSPDGTRLACTRPDGEWQRVVTFDASSGRQTAVCNGHRGDIGAFAFSPDGSRLVSGGEDHTARIWDPATGGLLATCRGHSSRIIGAAFRPDGARLVTTSSDGTVRQWDAAGGEVEAPYDRHTGEVVTAVYSRDGQWIASAGTDRTVRVWRATGRQDVAILHGHTGAVTGVAFAPDGRRLASLSSERGFGSAGDGTVRLWDLDPGATLPVLRGHTRAIYPVAFSPDGHWIASGSWDSTVWLWDAATGEPCASLPHPGIVHGLAFGPDGRWLVTGTDADNRLRLWDTATASLRKGKEIPFPTGGFRSVTVSPDGRRVAATVFDPQSNKHHLHVGDLASGERLFSAEGWALAYSPDGRWLAARAAEDKTVLLLDARTHEEAARFSGHDKPVFSAAFSPDSRFVATCSADRTVRVWPIDGGACRELSGHTDEVFGAAFHPDGRRLATGGRDGAVWLWDLERREVVARLPGHTSFVRSLAFSRDGTTLVSGSGDATVRLWDTAPLKERYEARREAEALRPEAERLVDRVWRQKKNPDEVVEALRVDPALSEPLRHAALRAVMRRAQPPETVPGKD